MEKQKKQVFILAVLLLVLVVAYFAIHIYNGKQEEKESAKEEAEKIYVTNDAVEDITAFSYVLDGETLSFTKSGDEWTYDGDTGCNLDESVIETMLGKIASITADECLSEPEPLDSYGLDAPSGQITFTTDKETVTLLIGNRNAITGSYYLKKDGDDKVYLVSSTVAAACTKSISDLLAEEDTETEEPEEAETLSTEELGTEE